MLNRREKLAATKRGFDKKYKNGNKERRDFLLDTKNKSNHKNRKGKLNRVDQKILKNSTRILL